MITLDLKFGDYVSVQLEKGISFTKISKTRWGSYGINTIELGDLAKKDAMRKLRIPEGLHLYDIIKILEGTTVKLIFE